MSREDEIRARLIAEQKRLGPYRLLEDVQDIAHLLNRVAELEAEKIRVARVLRRRAGALSVDTPYGDGAGSAYLAAADLVERGGP